MSNTHTVFCGSPVLTLLNTVCTTRCAGVGEGCVGVPARGDPQDDDHAAASVTEIQSLYNRRIAVGELSCAARSLASNGACLTWPRLCPSMRCRAVQWGMTVAPHTPVGTNTLGPLGITPLRP